MVELSGVAPNPGGNFMTQVARNLTDHVDGFLRNKKFLILDNDALFAKGFCNILGDAGPDGLGPRDKLIADSESSHRSANSAETADYSLVIGEFEAANSVSNGLGAICGHCGLEVYAQGGVFDAGINALNQATSNGVKGTIGDV